MSIRFKELITKAAFILYIAAVAWCCFGRPEQLPEMDNSIFGIPTDKVAHFLMFLPFPILSFMAFDRFTRTPLQTIAFVFASFVVGLLLAGATEYLQSLTDYRSGDLLDLAADALGLFTGSCITTLIDIRKQKKNV